MLSVTESKSLNNKKRRFLPVIPHTMAQFGSSPKEKNSRFHLLEGDTPLVFVIDGSQLFAVDPEFFAQLKSGETEALKEIDKIADVYVRKEHDFEQLEEPSALSLNIAQNCNLSCSYCYADEGKFGGKATFMKTETAFAAIDNLLKNTVDRPVTIGFIGGEPLINRKVLYESVEYTLYRARLQNTKVNFSITTNATLLQPSDIQLLRENAFTVTVSLDGDEKVNNRLRRANNGTNSYAQAIENLRPLLQNPGNAKISARATVGRNNLKVLERIEALAAEGFTDIGVSPLRQSPDPSLLLSGNDWSNFLNEMIRAGRYEIFRLTQGNKLRFSNFASALRQIHQGTNRNLPCGSAVNYVSVSADGNYFTCHRTIDNDFFALGDTENGLSKQARQEFLRTRQVDKQEPCASCWARYLCGGGCHSEVHAVGRDGCDYIRGWLEFCLYSYDYLAARNLLFQL